MRTRTIVANVVALVLTFAVLAGGSALLGDFSWQGVAIATLVMFTLSLLLERTFAWYDARSGSKVAPDTDGPAEPPARTDT